MAAARIRAYAAAFDIADSPAPTCALLFSMFRIKICGITNVEDALDTAAAGADAIGLNFYRGSKRFVDARTAKSISESLPGGVKKVGVFVNSDASEIEPIANQVQLDFIQLHGDEPPQFLAELPRGLSIIRAFRGVSTLVRYLTECRLLGRMPAAVLIDAEAGLQYGGTGIPADWMAIHLVRNAVADLPLILGGGLTPSNVAEAISIVRPNGVDVASGVEREPGRKDSALVRKFVWAARNKLATL